MNRGLHQPGEFRDNCGFGLIAHMEGQASHDLLKTAIESLTCMTHRGGIAADGKTGDGCGLLLKMPAQFMRAAAKESLDVELGERFAVGSVFLPNDDARAAKRDGRVTVPLRPRRRVAAQRPRRPRVVARPHVVEDAAAPVASHDDDARAAERNGRVTVPL